jgi:hypothetical protein
MLRQTLKFSLALAAVITTQALRPAQAAHDHGV